MSASEFRVTTVQEYIDRFPPERQAVLEQVRAAVHRGVAAGGASATERVRYGIPAVAVDDRHALHFAGWSRHLALYPVPLLAGDLEARIARYREAKATASFPWSGPIPYLLIEQVSTAIVRDWTRTG